VHAFGQRAKAALDRARAQVASMIEAEPADLVVTSGGTESDNMAIRGAFEAARPGGRRRIVISSIEHEAVLNTARALSAHGAEVVTVPTRSSGVVDLDALVEAVTPETAIVSLMLANNEIGTLQPVAEVAARCRDAGVLVHTDAVQAAGRIPVSVRNLGADLLTLSAHKFRGPKGAGVLWIRRGTKLVSQATGGRQERNRRAGTENLPAIVGMGVAAELARANLSTMMNVEALRDALEQRILREVPGTVVNGTAARVPNTTNISFDGVEAESLLIALDLAGIAVSTGSACSSGSLEPSHVLRAMGLPNPRARNSLRFSLGVTTTPAEIDEVAARLPGLVEKLRRLRRPAEAVR
jgi:cysteine desulfurase